MLTSPSRLLDGKWELKATISQLTASACRDVYNQNILDHRATAKDNSATAPPHNGPQTWAGSGSLALKENMFGD